MRIFCWRQVIDQSPIIKQSAVNLVRLSLELANACIDHDITDDASIYITEKDFFPFWISLKKESSFILLWSYVPFFPEVPLDQRMLLCNIFNKNVYLPFTHVREDRLQAEYPIYQDEGLIRSHFIRLVRTFSESMHRLFKEFDPDGAVLNRAIGKTN